MLEFIQKPWPWYVSGIMIVAVMLVLLFFGKSFGFSSNLRTLCTMCGANKKSKFFDFDWKRQLWNIYFLIGTFLGGLITHLFFDNPEAIQLSQATIDDLTQLGIKINKGLNPDQIFSLSYLFSIKGFLTLAAGGFFVGFGSRWAGGCTSGHAISGLSNLQLPSLIAVIGFFIGGLFVTHVLFPYLISTN
jgi:uncharacterized membrane protein YedE/YeeE